MRRIAIAAGVGLIGLAVTFFALRGETADVKPAEPERAELQGGSVVAAPGLIEAASEEIEVAAEVPGKLARVLVEEGEEVIRGQTIAVLENNEYVTAVDAARSRIASLEAAQATARARAAQARAERERIVNGARTEERIEARSAYEQTLPNVDNTRREYERAERLYRTGDVSREEFERAETAYENAQRQARTQRERYNVVNAAARKDDVARADAAIRLADSQAEEYDALISEALAAVREAEARLEKTIVRSPIAGVVLRKRLKGGESVTPESPTGIVSVADRSALRVRVDLDETDVAAIALGQRAYVTADAYGERRFGARVVKIGEIFGRKNFRTDRPTERVDTRILEILLELDPGQELPLGLRVDAFIETSTEENR